MGSVARAPPLLTARCPHPTRRRRRPRYATSRFATRPPARRPSVSGGLWGLFGQNSPEVSSLAHPSVEAVCYVDDIIVGGRAAALAQALQDLPAFLKHWGLQMASAKTRLWSPSPDTLQQLRSHGTQLDPSDGLLICGHTLTAEDSEMPFGAPAFTEAWLAQKVSHESRLLQRLLRYGDALDDVPTWHLVYQLLQCFWPARLMHLMRSLPYDHFSGTLEQIQDHLNEAYLYLMQVDRMSPLQWKVAHLPPAHGGLGVPQLASLSLCARSAALAALAHTEASSVVHTWIQQEQDGLIERLRGFTAEDPTSILGTIDQLPVGRAVKPLQRHLSASILLSELHDVKQKVNQDPILAWQWERHRTFANDRGHLLHANTSWWLG